MLLGRHFEDMLLELEIRNDTTRRFKAVDGRLVELPPRDAFNHSKNREDLMMELDPRIELGHATEYDKEVQWIYSEEERKWYEGKEPDWGRLREHVENRELAAANGSSGMTPVTADEASLHHLNLLILYHLNLLIPYHHSQSSPSNHDR